MSNVNLMIAGRSHLFACAPGEEPHVQRLGAMIDEKAKALGESIIGQSDARQLLFAGLMLADELHELRQRGAAIAAPMPTGSPVEVKSDTADAELASRMEKLAEQLEKLAASG